jgi:hypothetical protein
MTFICTEQELAETDFEGIPELVAAGKRERQEMTRDAVKWVGECAAIAVEFDALDKSSLIRKLRNSPCDTTGLLGEMKAAIECCERLSEPA